MIETHLDRLLLEQKMTLTELAGRVGITVANLSILKTGKARAMRIATLDAICASSTASQATSSSTATTTDSADVGSQ